MIQFGCFISSNYDWWIEGDKPKRWLNFLFSSSNFLEKHTTNVPLLFVRLICIRDEIITIKVCNRANPSQVGFAHMYEHCFLLTHDFFFCHLPLPLHSKVMTCLKWPFKQMQIFQMADVILNCSERQQTPSLFWSFCFAVFFISTPSSLYHHLLPLFKNRFDRSMYDPLISDAFSKKPACCCYDMATLVWICTCAE